MAGSGTSLWRKDLALPSLMTGVTLMMLSRWFFNDHLTRITSSFANIKILPTPHNILYAGPGREGPWRAADPSWAHSRQSVEWWRSLWWGQARWWWRGKSIIYGDKAHLTCDWCLAGPWDPLNQWHGTPPSYHSFAAPWRQDWLPGGCGKPLLFNFLAGLCMK